MNGVPNYGLFYRDSEIRISFLSTRVLLTPNADLGPYICSLEFEHALEDDSRANRAYLIFALDVTSTAIGVASVVRLVSSSTRAKPYVRRVIFDAKE